MTESELLKTGSLLGSCLLEERIGNGGMGVVYKATDRHLRRTVAVKVLRPGLYADKVVRMRFEREAASAAALEHPHVVRVYAIDLDPESRQPYIVMEYVPGTDLASLLREGELGQR